MRLLLQSAVFLGMFLGPFVGVCQHMEEETAEAPAPVLLIQVHNQPITPVLTRYVGRALDEADTGGIQCIIIELDTPGGLIDSTRKMVKDILGSPVPVVVYVAPSGARAASGGLFITLSAHIAAMAPGTHIGAAHPVAIGGIPVEPAGREKSTESESEESPKQAPTDPMADKIVNDTRAWARALAELRGRNADWAELAVTESRSITSQEAEEKGVVDMVAADLPDLLQMLDGREVKTADRVVTLHTGNASVQRKTMWWGDRLLSTISNPNIAFILLIFGFYGMLFELYTPGWGVAGTLGAICLVLSFFGLAVLPVNFAGLVLIGVALAMFVAEAFITSFGALTAGGAICLVLGGLMLVDSPTGFLRVSASVVVPVAIASAAITFFLVTRIVAGHRSPVQTGDQSLQGSTAAADREFQEKEGTYEGVVRIHGELWKASSKHPVAAGETVVVRERHGLVLSVEPDQMPVEANGK